MTKRYQVIVGHREVEKPSSIKLKRWSHEFTNPAAASHVHVIIDHLESRLMTTPFAKFARRPWKRFDIWHFASLLRPKGRSPIALWEACSSRRKADSYSCGRSLVPMIVAWIVGSLGSLVRRAVARWSSCFLVQSAAEPRLLL